MEHKNGMEFYGTSADVWAVGVLTYELLVGSLPFQGKDRYQISRSIMTDQPKFPSWLSQGAQASSGAGIASAAAPHPSSLMAERPPARLQDFIAKGLSKLPSMRPSMKDLLRHPWIVSYANLQPASVSPSNAGMVERATSIIGPGMLAGARPAPGDDDEDAAEIELQKPRLAKIGAPR